LLTCIFTPTQKRIIRVTATTIEVLLTFIKFTMTYKTQRVLVMECIPIFLTCRHLLVYYIYFTMMGSCYLYHESKTRYYWSNWWPFSLVSLVSLEHRTTGIEFILFKGFLCRQATSFFSNSHKLHSAISPSILQQFSQSQWLQKALKKTFQLSWVALIMTKKYDMDWN